MEQVRFSIPDEIAAALEATPEGLTSRIRLAAAVKLFELGQLSSGAAAELAGVPKPYFLSRLADYGVHTFDAGEEELTHDLEQA
jgi:predicted HTH domain antitoxin